MQTALQELASATPVNGAVQLIFNPVRDGKVWTGSIIIASNSGLPLTSLTIAPIQWEAKDNGNTIAKWFNDLPSPTMQAKGQVIVTGSNIANAEILQARYYGVATNLNETPIVWPTPPPAPPASVPKVIVSNNISLPGGTTQIGTSQPVVVGTSLEIFECIVAPFNLGVGRCRLAIQWSVDGSFTDPIEWDFDMDMNTSMRGLVLPNLGPFVRFLGLSSGGIQISLTVLTGLAPITRPPIIPTGILYSAAPAVGNSTIQLVPYVGKVFIEMQPNNAAGFGVQINSYAYSNIGVPVGSVRHEQGWPAGTGPYSSGDVLFLPPLINQLAISGAPGGANVSVYVEQP
jgi:hypothetical protein